MLDFNQFDSTRKILDQNLSLTTGPKFLLRTESGNNLIYFPHVSTLLWEKTGFPIDLSKVGYKYREFHHDEVGATSELRPLGKSRTPDTVKISLGFACNYSCTYCGQSQSRNEESIKKKSDIPKLITKLNENLVINDSGKSLTFELWGGEPLAYWESFKEITLALKKHYPAAGFKTVTNASLLNREKLDFLVEHQFRIGISHDGPGYHLRGRDPLEKPLLRELIKELVTKLPGTGFNCVLTANNYSLRDIYLNISERLEMDVYLSTEGLVSVYDEGSAKVFPINDETHRKIRHRIKEDLLSYLPDGTPLLARLATPLMDFQKMFFSLSTSKPAVAVGQKCGMDRPEALSIDLEGNATTCQNVSVGKGHGIGHIDKYDDIRLSTSNHWSHHDNCRNCAVVQLCQGSCMYLKGEERKPTCDGHFTYFIGTFAAILFDLAGENLVSVEAPRVRLAGQTKFVF